MTEPLRHQPVSERVRAFLDGEFRSSPAYLEAQQDEGLRGFVRSVGYGIQVAGLRILLVTEPDRVGSLSRSIEQREISPLHQLRYSSYTEEVGALASQWDREWDPHGLEFLELRKMQDQLAIGEIGAFAIPDDPVRFALRVENTELEMEAVTKGEDIMIDYYRGLVEGNN